MFAFFDGGAENELTLAANRAAFTDLRLLPRVLVDVEQVDTGRTMLGQAARRGSGDRGCRACSERSQARINFSTSASAFR